MADSGLLDFSIFPDQPKKQTTKQPAQSSQKADPNLTAELGSINRAIAKREAELKGSVVKRTLSSVGDFLDPFRDGDRVLTELRAAQTDITNQMKAGKKIPVTAADVGREIVNAPARGVVNAGIGMVAGLADVGGDVARSFGRTGVGQRISKATGVQIDGSSLEDTAVSLRKTRQEFNQNYAAPESASQNRYLRGYGQVGEAVGSTVPYLVGGLPGRAVKVGAGLLAGGGGADEQNSRVEQQLAQGRQVSEGQEFASEAAGFGVGLLELAPVKSILSKVPSGYGREVLAMISDRLARSPLGRFAGRLEDTVTGRIASKAFDEGLQELMSGLAQDLIELGIYNPDVKVGENALRDFNLGAAAGGTIRAGVEGVRAITGANRQQAGEGREPLEDIELAQALDAREQAVRSTPAAALEDNVPYRVAGMNLTKDQVIEFAQQNSANPTLRNILEQPVDERTKAETLSRVINENESKVAEAAVVGKVAPYIGGTNKLSSTRELINETLAPYDQEVISNSPILSSLQRVAGDTAMTGAPALKLMRDAVAAYRPVGVGGENLTAVPNAEGGTDIATPEQLSAALGAMREARAAAEQERADEVYASIPVVGQQRREAAQQRTEETARLGTEALIGRRIPTNQLPPQVRQKVETTAIQLGLAIPESFTQEQLSRYPGVDAASIFGVQPEQAAPMAVSPFGEQPEQVAPQDVSPLPQQDIQPVDFQADAAPQQAEDMSPLPQQQPTQAAPVEQVVDQPSSVAPAPVGQAPAMPAQTDVVGDAIGQAVEAMAPMPQPAPAVAQEVTPAAEETAPAAEEVKPNPPATPQEIADSLVKFAAREARETGRNISAFEEGAREISVNRRLSADKQVPSFTKEQMDRFGWTPETRKDYQDGRKWAKQKIAEAKKAEKSEAKKKQPKNEQYSGRTGKQETPVAEEEAAATEEATPEAAEDTAPEETPETKRPEIDYDAVIEDRLSKIEGRGRQGRVVAARLRDLLSKSNYDGEQLYYAFRMGEVFSRVLPKNASVDIMFVPSLKATNADAAAASGIETGAEAGGQYAAYRISQNGFRGLITMSLSPNVLSVARENAAHEAFHVIQDMLRVYDPQAFDTINEAFSDGMTIDGLDPSILRKLKALTLDGEKSVYQSLKDDFGNTPLGRFEAQAIAFGALVDAKDRGENMKGLKASFIRVVDMLSKFRSAMNELLRKDGVTNIADIFETYRTGKAQEALDGEAPLLEEDGREQYSPRGEQYSGRTGRGRVTPEESERKYNPTKGLDSAVENLKDDIVAAGGKVLDATSIDELVSSDQIPVLTMKDLVGKKIFPTISDRTAAAALYTGIDSSKTVAVPLLGGPLFPLRMSSIKSRLGWANRGGAVLTKKMNKVAEGAKYMMVMMGDADMHQSNTTVNNAYFVTLEAYARDGRISGENATSLTEMIKTAKEADPRIQKYLSEFPGFGDVNALDNYIQRISFDARKRIMTILGSKAALQLGAPSLRPILEATREPSMAGHRWGDGVLLLELDGDGPINLGEDGTQKHPDFPLGIRGKVVGRFETPISYEVLWQDFIRQSQQRTKARGKRASSATARYDFQQSLPIVEVTQELADRIGELKVENIDSARQARLAADMVRNEWRTSDQSKKDGGISIQEFVDAINNSPAKTVLNEYTASGVTADVKAGKMSVYQLGKDGQIFFALKKGDPQYAEDYGVDIPMIGKDEVMVTAVINNEQGARGIAGPAVMLKAVEQGATVLDCFAVKSDKFPNGFLPALYEQFGFVKVAEVPFAKEYYSDRKLADAVKYWKDSTPGYDPETDGYPPLVIMKWNGTDEERKGILERYLAGGVEGLLEGGDTRPATDAEAELLGDGAAASGEGRTTAVSERTGGDQGTGAGASLTSRARGVVQAIAELTDQQLDNLGLTKNDRLTARLAILAGQRDRAARAGDGQGDVEQGLTVPPVEEDGTITLDHWSTEEGLTESDPNQWGKSGSFLPKDERVRIGEAPKRTYFGIATGKRGGYRREFGSDRTQYVASIKADRLYDMRNDPLGLKKRGAEFESGANYKYKGEEVKYGETLYERLIQDAGYDGYWIKNEELGLVAAVFGKVPMRQVEFGSEANRQYSGRTGGGALATWFGNSKVTDADGNPLQVYHGTSKDANFRSFKVGPRGTWFTTDPESASQYANENDSQRLVMDEDNRPWGMKKVNTASRVIPAYLKIENPKVYTGNEMRDEVFKRGGNSYARGEAALFRELTAAGHDGVQLTGNQGGDVWVALKDPRQIKSIFNQAFDQNDVKFSGRTGRGTTTGYRQAVQGQQAQPPQKPQIRMNAPKFTSGPSALGFEPQHRLKWAEKYYEYLVNRTLPVKRLIKNIDDVWNDKTNFDRAEQLMGSRAANQQRDFHNKEVRKLFQEIGMRGLTVEEVEKFLHNKHAVERNAVIRERNDMFPDGGSGITDADARSYLASIPADKLKRLEAVAKKVNAITDKTLQILQDAGVESADTVRNLRETYKNYVPLFREGVDGGNPLGTRGASVQGGALKAALGSNKPVENILANVIFQREGAIHRAEANRLSNTLFQSALENQDQTFWMTIDPSKASLDQVRQQLAGMGMDPDLAKDVFKSPTKRAYNKRTGVVETMVDTGFKSRPNVVATRIDGTDKYVVFNPENEMAMKVAAVMRNDDLPIISGAQEIMVNAIGPLTRMWGQLRTQFMPEFGPVNMYRDLQGVMVNLVTTPLNGKQLQIMKESFKNAALLTPVVDAANRGLDGNPKRKELADLFERFEKAGGRTAIRDQFFQSEERKAEDLKKEMDKAIKQFNAGKRSAPQVVIDSVMAWNDALENATRLAVFKAGIDEGLTDAQAAEIAKNISVNFNQRGRLTREMNAYFAFFNATTASNDRNMQVMLGPYGKKILAGGISLGILQGVLLAAAGYDDDDVPEWVKDHAFVIPIYGTDSYLPFPMPYFYNMFPAIGRRMVEVARGEMGLGEFLTGSLKVIITSLSPLAFGASVIEFISPSVTDMFVEWWQNKDGLGRRIYNENMNDLQPTTGLSRARGDNTVMYAMYSKVAEAINYIAGGDEFTPGEVFGETVSPTPEEIKFFVEQTLPPMTFVYRLAGSIEKGTMGDNIEATDIPFIRRFYGEVSGKTSEGNKFYDNVKEMNVIRKAIKAREEAGLDTTEYTDKTPGWEASEEVGQYYREVSELRKERRELIMSGAPRSEIKAKDEEVTAKMKEFNDMVKSYREADEQ